MAVPLALANWIAALISGESSPTLHRFLSAYIRYVTHVVAYVTLTANPFPGFTGRAGSYRLTWRLHRPAARTAG